MRTRCPVDDVSHRECEESEEEMKVGEEQRKSGKEGRKEIATRKELWLSLQQLELLCIYMRT